MARSFDGSNDGLSASVDLSTFSAISLVFWMYWDSFANNDDLAFELSTNYNNVTTGFNINPNASTGVFAVGHKGNIGYCSATFTRPSAAAWHHYVVILDKGLTTNEAVVYVDGVSQGLTFGVNANNTNNFGNHTLYFMTRGNTTLYGAGDLAEVGIYGGVTLNVSEALALTAGFAPPSIRPTSLKYYWPLIGRTSPEVELMQGATAALSDAPATADHPRIIYPSRRRVHYKTIAAAGGKPWLYYANQMAQMHGGA